MNTHLFTGLTSAHIQRSKDHCLAEVNRTREHLVEMQDRFDEALNRYVETNICAGFRSASMAQELAFKQHAQAIALYQQYMGD